MKSFFISSTFKDMQAERDMLHQVIFPKLRRKLKFYGEDIQELDLRWGVDTSLMTEEESGYHVIESCIDSIDRCRPYMIILIGERYGWIPDAATVANTHDARIADWYQEPISITQMEILYGALGQENLERCIFCFRDESFSEQLPENLRSMHQAESKLHSQKLAALKEKIRGFEGAKIIEYYPTWDENDQKITGMESLEEQLTRALWEMLEVEVARNVSDFVEQQILEQARLTAKRYMESYIPREGLNPESALNGRSAVWYYGSGGCGKSAFLSSIYDGAISTGNHVFIYYCGNENCGSVDVFLDTLHYWLKQEHGEEFEKADRDLSRTQKMHYILKLLERPRTCDRMILVDAADQMDESILEILINLGKAVIRETVGTYTFGLVATSLDTYYSGNGRQLRAADFFCREIGNMNPTEVIAVSQLHAKQRGKHLDARAQNAIRGKSAIGNPYYLSLVLQQLFMMGGEDFEEAERLAPGMEGLSLYMEQLIRKMPDDLNAMTIDTLLTTVNKMQRRNLQAKSEWDIVDPMTVFALIAVSREGLTLGELEDLAEMQGKILLPMEMQRLLCFLYDAFCESNTGRWDFSHRLLRKNLISHMSKEQYCGMALLLCRYAQQHQCRSEAFYYALHSENKEEIRHSLKEIMSCEEKERSKFLAIYRLYVLGTGQHLDFYELELDGDVYGWFVSQLILDAPDEALKENEFWQKMIEGAKKQARTKEVLYQLALAEMVFLHYCEKKQPYIDGMKNVEKIFYELSSPKEKEAEAYYKLILTILSDVRFQSASEELEKMMGRLEKCVEDGHVLQHTFMLTNLRTVLQRFCAWRQTKGEDSVNLLKDMKDQLIVLRTRMEQIEPETYSSLEKLLYHTVMARLVMIAEAFNSKKSYGEAFAVMNEVGPWLEKQIKMSPTIAERRLYLYSLEVKIEYLKVEYAKKLIEPYRMHNELLFASVPMLYFKRELAYSYYMEVYVLDKFEKIGKKEFDHNRQMLLALREGIQLYDEILAGKSDDEKDSIALDMAVYLRYRRVTMRLEQDLWNWTDDKEINVVKKAPWFEEMMEQDLKRLVDGICLLYKLEDNGQRLYEAAWAYLYGVQYYDRHQETDKMTAWCTDLLAMTDKLQAMEPNGGRLVKARFYIEAAEALVRHGKWDDLDQIVEKSLVLLNAISADTNKHEEKIKRYRIRAALVLMKTGAYKEPADILSQYEELTAIAESFEKEERYLISELKQSMAEIYYRSGQIEQAILLLEECQTYWPKPQSIWVSRCEQKLQRSFYYLQGQALLARLKKDESLLEAVIDRYQKIVENQTTNKDTIRRPILLAEAKKIETYYQQELPERPLPEKLQYILFITEDVRKQQNWKKLIIQEQKKWDCLKHWEEETLELTDPEYLEALKAVNTVQNDMIDNVVKGSEDHRQLFARQMKLLEKFRAYHWAIDNIQAAVYYERFFMAQFTHKKEWMEQMYSAKGCWENWLVIKEKRKASPYIKRSVQADWVCVSDFGLDICERLYQETGDVGWLYQEAQEAIDYRTYMNGHLSGNPEDLDWNQEQIHRYYTYEQNAYIKIWERGLSEEEKWLEPYLKSLDEQLDMVLRIPGSFYTEVLEALYKLQDAGLRNQNEIKKAIEKVTRAKSGGDKKFGFYMQKAVRELPPETPINEVMSYINKLKEKEEAGEN